MIDNGVDKNLPAQDESNEAPASGAGTNAHVGTAIGAYAAKHDVHTQLKDDPWKNDRKRWRDSLVGRATVRLAARGLVGAAFFSAGEAYAGRTLHGNQVSYRYFDPNFKVTLRSPITHQIAAVYDWVFTKPMIAIFGGRDKAGLLGIRNVGEELMTYRPTRHFYNIDKFYHSGRSFGSDVVATSFGFACMSFGDSTVRYGARLFDPKEKKPWDKHKDKNIFVKARDTALYFGEAWLRNVGEDWFATIFYVPFVRMQRRFIDNISPGFKYDSDRGLNGGSFKIQTFESGKTKIVGDYQLEGMADLFGRFTIYNVFTKWWQDLVSAGQDKYQDWKKSGFKEPLFSIPHDGLIRGGFRKAGDITEYMIRSSLKSITYMVPASPIFAILRSPQSKQFGGAIVPGKSRLAFNWKNPVTGEYQRQTLFADQLAWDPAQIAANETVRSGKRAKQYFDGTKVFLRDSKKAFDNPFGSPNESIRFKPYEQHVHWFGRLTDGIGKACYDFGTWFKPWGKETVAGWFGIQGSVARGIFSRRYAYAALAYTPYFYVKTDVGMHYWDNQQMNSALDRMVHGLTHANWNDFTGGWSEYWQTVRRKPLDDPQRIAEVEARRAYEVAHGREDRSPAPPQWWIDQYYRASQATPPATANDNTTVTAEPAAFKDREARGNSTASRIHRGSDSWASGVKRAQSTAERFPQSSARPSSHAEGVEQKRDPDKPAGVTLH